MRLFRSSVAVAAVVAAGVLAPDVAQAATVSAVSTHTSGSGAINHYLNYQAAPGEANTVVITTRGRDFGGWLVSDVGAPLTAGAGCTSIDAHTANCPEVSRIAGLHVNVDLGDQSDWASVVQACTPINYDENSPCNPSTVDGGSGSDIIFGSDGVPSILKGGTGDDVLFAGKSGATLDGGSGGDTLFGAAARDRLFGGTGRDSLYGYAGNDTISGGRGRDTLLGGAGRDTFYAKDGYRDSITGGSGTDRAGIDRNKDTTKSVEQVHG